MHDASASWTNMFNEATFRKILFPSSRWWEKHLSKRSLIKHTYSWRVITYFMNTEQTSENIFTYVSTSYCFVSCNQTLVRSFDLYSKSFLYLNNLFYLKGRNVTSYVLVTSSWSQSSHQRCFIKKAVFKDFSVLQLY